MESEILIYREFDNVFVFPYTFSRMQRKVPRDFIVVKRNSEERADVVDYRYLCSEIAFLYMRNNLSFQNYSTMVEFYNKANKWAKSMELELKKKRSSSK